MFGSCFRVVKLDVLKKRQGFEFGLVITLHELNALSKKEISN
jgi:hypothetical protein